MDTNREQYYTVNNTHHIIVVLIHTCNYLFFFLPHPPGAQCNRGPRQSRDTGSGLSHQPQTQEPRQSHGGGGGGDRAREQRGRWEQRDPPRDARSHHPLHSIEANEEEVKEQAKEVQKEVEEET